MSFNNADVSRSPPPSSTITFERSKTLEPESGKLERERARERERERTHSSDDAPLLLRKLLSFWLIRLHKTPSRQLFWRLLKLPKTPKSLQSTISREPRKQRTSKAFIRAHRAGQRERERESLEKRVRCRSFGEREEYSSSSICACERSNPVNELAEGRTHHIHRSSKAGVAAAGLESSSRFVLLGRREAQREREILFDKSVVGGKE
jgi:hypothetical protein